MVKNLSAIQETQVHSLGQEDPLEKEMAIHSSILAWRIPWTKELGGLQSMGLQRGGQSQSLGQEESLEKKRQPTAIFLPGKFHGNRGLV